MANNHHKKETKERVNVVYSTNPDFRYEHDGEQETETLAPGKQQLRVALDARQRNGKVVTLVQGFVGPGEALKELARVLKSRCGVGGSVKEGSILIQGDFREKVLSILRDSGYRAK
ncbi:MAG: translation initiation factor [Odoribacteraceae bacterium]|jgi:translation initiation factor 1|nr:translation initiation factor [Odoribacteraceae bacterium]